MTSTIGFNYRAAALTSRNHMTNYFRKAKEHGVHWQLNRSCCLTCTPDHVAAQFSWHGNCATVTVDTIVLGKCQAACVSKITVELTTFFALQSYERNGIKRRVLRMFYGLWHQTQPLYSHRWCKAIISVFYASTKARVCFLFKITALLIFSLKHINMHVTLGLYWLQ